MKPNRGVYEENGLTKIRIWLGPKYKPDGSFNKPYRRSMGAWNNANITRANNHVDEVRKNHRNGLRQAPELEALPAPLACDIYFKREWTDDPTRTKSSIRNTSYGIERWKKYLRGRAWHTVLAPDLEAYATERRKAGVKEGTINRELTLISSVFTKINEWQERREIGPYILPTTTRGAAQNPAMFVKRVSTVGSERERVATNEEIRNVTIFCNQYDNDMLEIIKRDFFTGLRKADLKKVNGHADVRGILSKSREKKLFKFPLDFSRKLDYTNERRRWDRVRKACNMMDFHWHDWRHTAATRLSDIGFTDRQVQLFLGHSGAGGLEQTQIYINRGKKRLEPQVKGLQGHWAKVTEGIVAPLKTIPTHKTCKGCGVSLPLASFGVHSAAGDGLNSKCKSCTYKATKDRRNANPALRQGEYERRRNIKKQQDTSIYTSVPSVSKSVSNGTLSNGFGNHPST